MKKLLITLIILSVGASSNAIAAKTSDLPKDPKQDTSEIIKLELSKLLKKATKEEEKNAKEAAKKVKAEKEILTYIKVCAPHRIDDVQCVDIFKKLEKDFKPTGKASYLTLEKVGKDRVARTVRDFCKLPRTSVPDGGATLALLGVALLGLVGAQRFIRRS